MGDKLLLLFLAMATLVAACGGDKRETSMPSPLVTATPAEVVTITFSPPRGAPARSPDPHRELREVATRFQETHPYITVEIKLPDLGAGRGMKDVAQHADCFVWYPRLWDPETREVILNLQPFSDSDTSLTAEDFYPSLLEHFIWEGQLWGLPSDAQPYVIKYNKDLFDTAGVDYPSVD